MKFLFVLLFITLPFLAHSQLEIYGKYLPNRSGEPIINYYGEKKITEKLFLTFFSLARKEWSQALIGIKYAPSQSFNVSASTGIEHGTNSPRFGASIWAGTGKTSLLVLGELGAGEDNYLYKVNLFHTYSETFTVGVTAWRFHGIGPNFRVTPRQLATTFWLMPAYDLEFHAAKIMLGVSTEM